MHWIVADLRDWGPDAAAYDTVIVAYPYQAPAELTVVLGQAAAAVAPADGCCWSATTSPT